MSSSPAPIAPPELSMAECAERLKALFPALFGAEAKPVKLKIQADIQQRAPGQFTKQALSAFFRRYTGSTAYLIALTKSAHRFDLDGQPAGEISDEHRKVAADELTRRRANHRAKREQEQAQRRERFNLLRDYERTTLTRANFCALKGIAEADLDRLLAQAREEAAAAPPRRHPDRPQGRPDQRPHGRPPQARPEQGRATQGRPRDGKRPARAA
ncbi:MAG: ProQ/FinO family protein [Pseudomonadota bacterium]